jgi:ubiquinone/menaquinone biosynthesis C-methylase UbiE
MTTTGESGDLTVRNEKRRRAWAKQAPRYDKSMGFFERRLFGTDHRAWACSRAEGRVLEVAVGSGLNLPLYPSSVELTGVDLSPEMRDLARKRVAELRQSVDLREGDAHALPFADDSFDTVVCTYSLCNIPDPHRAIGEMKRVLRPGGRLLLVDHIRSDVKAVYWVQKVIELFSRRFEGEYMTRRPLPHVEAHGFEIAERRRLGVAGIVERIEALKPR